MRPAAEIPPFLELLLLPLLLPPLRFPPEPPDEADEAVVEPSVRAPVPRAFAQRARAAAASLARVAGDIGRRRPSCFAPAEEAAGEDEEEDEGDDLDDDEDEEDEDDARDDVCPPAPKIELSRSSRDCICSRIETASLSFSKDRSMASCNCYAC